MASLVCTLFAILSVADVAPVRTGIFHKSGKCPPASHSTEVPLEVRSQSNVSSLTDSVQIIKLGYDGPKPLVPGVCAILGEMGKVGNPETIGLQDGAVTLTFEDGFINQYTFSELTACSEGPTLARRNDGKHNIQVTQYTGPSTWLQFEEDAKRLQQSWIRSKNDPSYQTPPKETHQCSGDTWDAYDEALDVLSALTSIRAFADIGEAMAYKAHIAGSEEPLGVLVLQEDWDTHEADQIRFLVAHPTMKGAGGLLVKEAKREAKRRNKKDMTVISAKIAERFYEKHGFLTFSGPHFNCELLGKACQCKRMRRTFFDQ